MKLLALPLVLGALLAARSSQDDVEWRTDLAAATAEATESGRPLVIVFR